MLQCCCFTAAASLRSRLPSTHLSSPDVVIATRMRKRRCFADSNLESAALDSDMIVDHATHLLPVSTSSIIVPGSTAMRPLLAGGRSGAIYRPISSTALLCNNNNQQREPSPYSPSSSDTPSPNTDCSYSHQDTHWQPEITPSNDDTAFDRVPEATSSATRMRDKAIPRKPPLSFSVESLLA